MKICFVLSNEGKSIYSLNVIAVTPTYFFSEPENKQVNGYKSKQLINQTCSPVFLPKGTMGHLVSK